MTLNPKRRTALLCCAAAVIAMLVFPPLQFRDIGRGYGFILSIDAGLTINAAQLITQWIAVGIIGGIAFVLLGDVDHLQLDGAGKARGVWSRENTLRIAIPVMRTIRVPVALFGWWQCLGAFGWLLKTIGAAADPSSDLGRAGAHLLLQSISAVVFVGAAAILRSWIHRFHNQLHGSDHPDLPKWWRL